jgi:hypothetical protein
MAYFRNFPIIPYYFGNEIDPAQFQNLTAYIDLIDQIADDASFYEKYEIKDGERPDALSFRLYGTTDYYWMFYLLNEKIRRQGWPLTFQELQTKSKEYYPNKVITTSDAMHDRMYRGDIVIQGSITNPSSIGVILEKNLDLGHLIVKPIVEVRSITVTDGGAGYTQIPTVTITDEHGERHEEAIVQALASAQISGGEVNGFTIISGGSGYEHAPTVSITEPSIVDYEDVATKLDAIIAGTLTTGVYYDFLNETFNGYKRGDVNRNGSLTIADSQLIRDFNNNVNSVDVDTRARIRTTLRQNILENYTTYPDWVPYGNTGTTATATAVLSSSTFSTSQLISVPNIANWRDFDPGDLKYLTVDGVANQYDAVHHYENSDGEWVDIDPFDRSVGALSAVSYYDRLERQNDELKSINVLKPGVAAQVFNEFQKLLREQNG